MPVVRVRQVSLSHRSFPGSQSIIAHVAYFFRRLPGPLAYGHHGQIRQQTQDLLTAQKPKINVPVVHQHLYAAATGDKIHVKQGVYLPAYVTQFSHRRKGAAGGLTVNGSDESGAEASGGFAHRLGIWRFIVSTSHNLHLHLQLASHISYAVAEDTVSHRQDAVTRIQYTLQCTPQSQHPLTALNGNEVSGGENFSQVLLAALVERKKILLKICTAIVYLINRPQFWRHRNWSGHQPNVICFHGLSPLSRGHRSR